MHHKNAVRAMRTAVGAAGLAAALVAAGLPAGAGAAGSGGAGAETEYVVLYRDMAHAAAARAAVREAGGEILRENTAIGTALVRAGSARFTSEVLRGGAVLGAAHSRPIGYAPAVRPARDLVERLSPADRDAAQQAAVRDAAVRKAAGTSGKAAAARRRSAVRADAPAPVQEPLGPRQWDMAAIGATPTGSYASEPGDRRVRVGVIDTGVDGKHPDIAPNFDAAASRNFTVDIVDVDGPCEVENCVDPADVDDDGHGTHVASTIGSPVNGLGVAGVAPKVTLVNVRAGQDSGFFFLQPTVDALTYSADAGLDVVNMSFYVDPWLYNCAANAADSPESQAEQRTIVAAVQRAVDYAAARGVTMFGALGNEATDLGRPVADDTSPNYPKDTAYDRKVDNTCVYVPAETAGVISVSSIGPSGRKAAYSNYGLEQTDLAAPGGDAFDTPDNAVDPAAMVLAAYPEHLARASGDLEEDGRPTTPFVVQDCAMGVCAYYQYLQGTSMAAPHAAGVAALAVSRFGTLSPDGTMGLDPRLTTLALWVSADRRRCPEPATYTYVLDRASGKETFAHTCEESFTRNGFYGHGVVNAAALAKLPQLPGPPARVEPAPNQTPPNQTQPNQTPTMPAPSAQPPPMPNPPVDNQPPPGVDEPDEPPDEPTRPPTDPIDRPDPPDPPEPPPARR